MKTSKLSPLFFFILCSAISISLIGCGDSPSGTNDNGGNNGGGPNEPSPNEVGMAGQSFSPSSIEVEVGTTVTWTNESSVIHTVTSGTNGEHDGTFDSGNISPGGTFTYTFNEVGTYPYYCIPHYSAGMTGTVTVVESSDGGS